MDVIITGILAIGIATVVAQVVIFIVNAGEKIIVPKSETGVYNREYERYLARYELEIDSYAERVKNKSSRLLAVNDYLDLVDYDINHDNGCSLFVQLLRLSQGEKIGLAQFLEHRKRFYQYHFNSFVLICIALGVFISYISTSQILMAVELVILAGFLINKIYFMKKKILGYEFLAVFLRESLASSVRE